MTCDYWSGRTVVIGAGLVGLAFARELLVTRPGADVIVLDKEPEVAKHQSSHNSGVVHAGVYYTAGSLKAKLCARGRLLLRELCAELGLEYIECGKLVVALEAGEVPELEGIMARAMANGVPQVERLGVEQMQAHEPHITGAAALHSPKTAIVDYKHIATALAEDIIRRGGQLRLGFQVTEIRRDQMGVTIRSSLQEARGARVVICGGLHGDRLAEMAGDDRGPRVIPFRGEYYRLRVGKDDLVRGLVYPVPDRRYPFLGVHFTRRVHGGVDIGPKAVLALSREGYSRWDLSLKDLSDMIAWPGARRMARAHWRAGVRELHSSFSRKAFLDAARAYLPCLDDSDVVPGGTGVRAQAVCADGTLVDDFCIHVMGRVAAVRNAPSPAATSCLAIGEYLVNNVPKGL